MTSLIYRIRGNQTYLVIALAFGFFLLIPILFAIGSLRPESVGEGMFILISAVLLLAGFLFFFLMRNASTSERKAL